MAKHKSICWITTILVIIGGLNWGLFGLGMLLNINLNVVNLLLGFMPTLEYVVYLIVGVATVVFLIGMMKCKDCACTAEGCKPKKEEE